MKALALVLVLVVVTGCASRVQERRLCPPLPELEALATEQQRANHHAIVIRLYAQCASGELP